MPQEVPIWQYIFEMHLRTRKYQIFLSQNNGEHPGDTLYTVLKTEKFVYNPFCDDFGPMSLLSIVGFIEELDRQINESTSDVVVCAASSGPRALTNAAFLLGAYMLLSSDLTPSSIAYRFSGIDPSLFVSYRDAAYYTPDFGITLLDCWCGIHRAMLKGWLARPSSPGSRVWGRIDVAEYAQYDDPLNADLHEVIPGKFVAFRGPQELGCADYRDRRGHRQFAPSFYVPIFRELNVSAVVQLNENSYDTSAFTSAGIAHHKLIFDDCTVPPSAIIHSFLALAEGVSGPIAVHCRAGLGRTGTLIAFYMMKHHSFTAREAMGWLRVMRPGSVIGPQQHFLVAMESGLPSRRADQAAPRGCDRHEVPKAGSAAAAPPPAVLAEQFAAAAARRGVSRAGKSAPNLQARFL